MSRKLIQETNLQNIAAAIRAKNGGNSTYKPREMADAIRALPSPGTLVPKAITQNGSYSPASENADGFSSVTVNVGRNLVHKNITRNGSFSAASDHVDGFSSVSVDVPNSYNALDEGKVVSSGSLSEQTSRTVTQNGTFDTTRNNQVTVSVSDDTTLVSKTITANGTYHPADDNADGYSSVSVAVPNSALSSTDEGKVVVNGALMPQTSLSVTANGTYDTTDKNSVAVNVSGGAANVIYSTEEPSGSGSQGSFWVYYDNTASIEVSVTGGYNGGAVIVVTVNGDEVYRAAGSSPYNTSYTVVNSAPSYISVTVTPPPDDPEDHTGDLIITLTGPGETKTFHIQSNGPNSSYGYNFFGSALFSTNWIKTIYIWNNNQWATLKSALFL